MIEIRGLNVAFGGVRAVNDVDLDVREGVVFGLVGPNGSGKSTLLNALTGVVPATGSVHLDGSPLRLQDPRAVWRRGVARTFQTPQPFGELTCMENVILGVREKGWTSLAAALLGRPKMFARERERWAVALSALAEVGLEDVQHDEAHTLSYGQRRFLEMARVLAMDPRVVLLDEPAAGLNDRETADLIELIVRLRDRGAVVIVVEHKIDFLNQTCDRLAVLNQGRIICEGNPDDVWDDEVVRSAYLGLV